MNIYSKTCSGEINTPLLFGKSIDTLAKTEHRLFGVRVWTTIHISQNDIKKSWRSFFNNFFKRTTPYSTESSIRINGWSPEVGSKLHIPITNSLILYRKTSTESTVTRFNLMKWKVETDVTTSPTMGTLSILGHTIFGDAQ